MSLGSWFLHPYLGMPCWKGQGCDHLSFGNLAMENDITWFISRWFSNDMWPFSTAILNYPVTANMLGVDRCRSDFWNSKKPFSKFDNDTMDNWLVVWNMNFMIFHILWIIIPTDFHVCQRGRYTTNQTMLTLNWEWCISPKLVRSTINQAFSQILDVFPAKKG